MGITPWGYKKYNKVFICDTYVQVIADADEHGAAVLGVLMKATVKVGTPSAGLLFARYSRQIGSFPRVFVDRVLGSAFLQPRRACHLHGSQLYWSYRPVTPVVRCSSGGAGEFEVTILVFRKNYTLPIVTY